MAENDFERTEQATPHRRQEARRDGNVAKSMDLTAACVMLAAVFLLSVLGMHLLEQLRHAVTGMLSANHASNLARLDDLGAIVAFAGRQFVLAAGPILLLLAAVAITATMGQIGFLITGKPLMPQLNKLNPLNGFKRLVDLRAGIRLSMNLLKLAALVAVTVWVIRNELPQIIKLAELTATQAFFAAAGIVYDLALKLAALLLVLAIIDYSYERWQRERDLRMTKQEVKEEMKRMDGDPLVKQRRARVARQLALQRIAAAVPQADVVVTNPTHFAVALRYDAETMNAPKVVAKGADFLAMRIRQLAMVHGVPLVERKELARALYRHVEIGREVPPEFYNAVAEILAYVYRLGRKSA